MEGVVFCNKVLWGERGHDTWDSGGALLLKISVSFYEQEVYKLVVCIPYLKTRTLASRAPVKSSPYFRVASEDAADTYAAT